MSKALVVVESPAKARTISRFLGDDRQVMASMGHVRDLPDASLGVDVRQNFAPAYVTTQRGKRVIRDLRKALVDATDVYLATDPDREGEAIAWHLQEELKGCGDVAFHRVTFHEITQAAVTDSFAHPGKVDLRKVDAQQARRVLDRLVGYQVSPLLWKHLREGRRKKLSAGRVQSVALRLVCERERAIQEFVPVEYWNLDALFEAGAPQDRFCARLTALDGKKPQVSSVDEANALATELDGAGFKVQDVKRTPRAQSAPPPFITSTLQQAAGSALRLGASQTMRIAQQLYEGIELGAEGAAGLITYMRTDSVTVAKEAQERARAYVSGRFGAEYVPEQPNVYRSRKRAQEAHEAIRPTDVERTPESVAGHLSDVQLRLYRLIWNRFVASQMAPAEILEHAIDVTAEGGDLTHEYLFRASTRQTTFPGYQVVYNVKEPDQEDDDPAADCLPELTAGQVCVLAELQREQCFTEPPRRYSEATLVRELEQNGVGRPSTYAAIVNTIQERKYVSRSRGRLTPSELGFAVNDYLVPRLPDLFEVSFTAKMESQLDEVEEGKIDWTEMLEEFHEQFRTWISEGLVVTAPAYEEVAGFLGLFPEDVNWAPPQKRGRRTYDDRKFFNSFREQVEKRKKTLSDKQWAALLALAARYADQIPGLRERTQELGVLPRLDELIAEEKARQEDEAQPPGPADLELLHSLAEVQWVAPVKRGRRSFNDRRFYRSLCDQVEAGRRLTVNQTASLRKLIAKYWRQVPNVEELAAKHGLEAPAEGSEQDNAEAEAMFELVGRIKEWATPRKRGGRVYDDKAFMSSLAEQFAQKGSLSPKQLQALRTMLSRYQGQIPEYEEKAEELQLPLSETDKAQTQPVDAECPECGAALARRSSRGRQFFGCSAFPKCRYTSARLPA